MRYAAPPEFSVAEEAQAWVEYAHVLFDGLIGLLPVLLACVAIFTLLYIAIRSIRRWVGAYNGPGAMYGGAAPGYDWDDHEEDWGEPIRRKRRSEAGYGNRHQRKRGRGW